MVSLDERRAMAPVPIDAATITGHVERLGDVLNQDSARVNGFLRQHLLAIDCMPTEQDGHRFYRAVVVPNGPEMIKSPQFRGRHDLTRAGFPQRDSRGSGPSPGVRGVAYRQ